MVQISVTPPGPRGRRVEYFFAKPRHRTIVPLIVVTAVCMAVAGWLAWPARAGTCMFFGAVALGELVMAGILWRRGERLARDQRHRGLEPTSRRT